MSSSTPTPFTTLPANRDAVLRVMPMPADANIHGDVFGGWIMSQVDIAGSIPAARARGPRGHGGGQRLPVQGARVRGRPARFYAAIVKTGNTSITVSVEVYAERQRLDAEVVKVTEAVLTYVATDEARRSRPYPNFEP